MVPAAELPRRNTKAATANVTVYLHRPVDVAYVANARLNPVIPMVVAFAGLGVGLADPTGPLRFVGAGLAVLGFVGLRSVTRTVLLAVEGDHLHLIAATRRFQSMSSRGHPTG